MACSIMRLRESIVRLLLRVQGIELDVPDRRGETPLWKAIQRDHIGICKLLIETGRADPNRKVGDHKSLLHYAASSGRTEIVTMLLSTQTVNDSAQENEGRTPLHWAMLHGQEPTVRALLASSAVNPTRRTNAALLLYTWQRRSINDRTSSRCYLNHKEF
jgi:ankyrin repeat protein